MVSLKLENFGGMIPAVNDYYLPETQAALSENAWVYSGALEGFRQLTEIYTCSSQSVRKVFRIPLGFYDKARMVNSYWMEFTDPDTDVVRSPIANDSFERFYWASPSHEPRYNTKARILANNPPFRLGVPAPVAAPTLAGSGGSGTLESRAYIYTWVTAYGEEGPPSPPSIVGTAYPNATWTVSLTAPSAAVTADRNITHVRIYRAVTSSTGVATYFRVTELPIATTSYADNTVNISGANQLQSLYWEPPPEDLKGLITMPNGIIAGFRSNEIFFCEPYRPHAWPVTYALSVEYPIIGLGVIGQTLIVCTAVSPYAISGVNPASMSVSRLAVSESCMSRGSIVSTPAGVVFASPEGLVLASPGGIRNITQTLATKDKWSDLLPLSNLRAAIFNDGYYCWGSLQGVTFQSDAFQGDAFQAADLTGGYNGAHIDFQNTRVAYTKLTTDNAALNVFSDVWTDEILVLKTGKVYWLDVSQNRPVDRYKWRSKIFSMPNRRNIEAMRVWFDLFPDSPTLNPVRNTNLEQTLQPNQWGLVRVYADDRLVMCRELRVDGEFMRLPSGFKAATYQVEIEARVRIISIEMSTSAKELINV
jgi:hypothetical protein